MLILAIECSGITGSVALFRDDEPLDYLDLPPHQSSVMSLSLTIQAILANSSASFPKSDAARGVVPGLIAVTNGPGSFTGLRVGLATAKTLAFAWKIPVVAVDSLAAIALRASRSTGDLTSNEDLVVVSVMNAFRKQLFASMWSSSGSSNQLRQAAPTQVVDVAAWQKQPTGCLADMLAVSASPRCLLTGPGLSICPQADCDLWTVADPSLWMPRAIEVAELGRRGFQNGLAVSATQLLPNYVRGSAAEEKAAKNTPRTE